MKEAMLCESRSNTAQRLSRFEGPDDVDYQLLVAAIKRSILVKHCVAQPELPEDRFPDDPILDINLQDQRGVTPLHHAVSAGNLHAVRTLIEKSRASVAIKDIDRRYPLLIAVKRAIEQRYGDSRSIFVEIIKLLVEAGRREGLRVDERDTSGKSPWIYANSRNNEWIKVLLKEPEVIEVKSPETTASREIVPLLKRRLSSLQATACDAFDATLTEVYLLEKLGSQIQRLKRDSSTIRSAIYGKNRSILDIPNTSSPDAPASYEKSKVCRWLHLPANNVSHGSV